jgi:hypothetical protein
MPAISDRFHELHDQLSDERQVLGPDFIATRRRFYATPHPPHFADIIFLKSTPFDRRSVVAIP